MDPKHPDQRKDADQEDQYSKPDCRARTAGSDTHELGPNARQLLGVLKSLQGGSAK